MFYFLTFYVTEYSTCYTKIEEEVGEEEGGVRRWGGWGQRAAVEGGVAPDTLCFGLLFTTANRSVKKFRLLLL